MIREPGHASACDAFFGRSCNCSVEEAIRLIKQNEELRAKLAELEGRPVPTPPPSFDNSLSPVEHARLEDQINRTLAEKVARARRRQYLKNTVLLLVVGVSLILLSLLFGEVKS